MREQTTQEIQKPRDRAILAGLSSPRLDSRDNADEETMAELAALVETAGGEVAASALQNRASPDPRTFIGEGKVAEIKDLVRHEEATMVIFDNDLSPSQMRVLTEDLGVQVLDRSALILDIFAQRARTREGRPTWSGRPVPVARAPSAPRAPARPSWRPTAATSTGRLTS